MVKGFVLIVPGLLSLASVRGLARGSLASWRLAFWSDLALLAVNAPIAPIQDSRTSAADWRRRESRPSPSRGGSSHLPVRLLA